jgi:hypothetical protein
MKRILLVLILLSAPFMAEAQINELGLWAGGANYVGDVGPTNYIAPNDLAIGLLYKWNRSPRHSWRASFTYARIGADDADASAAGRKQRDNEFENTIKELSVGMEFNFFDFNLHESGFKMTPYIYSGLSYFWYDEKYMGNNREAADYDNGSSLAIPMTVGIKTHIAPHLVLGLEAGARYTFTDNLDASNPDDDAYASRRFGNLESNDWYVFTGFTLTYTFTNKPCYCSQ